MGDIYLACHEMGQVDNAANVMLITGALGDTHALPGMKTTQLYCGVMHIQPFDLISVIGKSRRNFQ